MAKPTTRRAAQPAVDVRSKDAGSKDAGSKGAVPSDARSREVRARDLRPKESARRQARSRRRVRWQLIWVGALGLAGVAILALLLSQIFKTPGSLGSGAIGTITAPDYHALAFSPDDSNVAFFGNHNGILRTTDGGRSWQPLVDRRNFDAMGMAIDPSNAKQIYIAGHDIFQVSSDGGASWQPVASNLPGTDIHGFAMSRTDPRRLYAFVAGNGPFVSADGGQSWQPLGGQLPGDVMSLAAAGGNPEALYATSMGSGLLRTTDGGQTWVPASSGLGAGDVRTVTADPTAPKTVYAGTGDGLYKSADAGATWSKLPFPGDNIALTAVSPARPSVLLVIGLKNKEGLVYRSEDGGATWGQNSK